jgi:hypothetical protein
VLLDFETDSWCHSVMKLHRFLKKNFWSESVFTLLFYTDLLLPLAPVHPLLAVDSVQSRHVKFLHSLQTSAWECWSKKNKKIKSWSTYCSSYITTATKKGKKRLRWLVYGYVPQQPIFCKSAKTPSRTCCRCGSNEDTFHPSESRCRVCRSRPDLFG